MMKKIILPLLSISLLLAACNNATPETIPSAETKEVDSLNKLIDDIHVKGMSKMGQLNNWQNRTRAFIDSLDKLPAKSKEQVKNLRAEADSLLQELDYADFAMNKWMPDFYGKADTLSNDVKAKISYLIAENEKATRITDAIVNGIRKADSLLRR